VRRAALVLTTMLNVWRLVFGRGLRGWARNISTAAPAVGSMSLLLCLGSAIALVGIAVANVAAVESAQVYTLHVYLRDDASAVDVDALWARLEADPRVAGVAMTDKTAALSRALHRPGMAALVDSAGENPFPASLDVSLKSKDSLPALATDVAHDPAVDPGYPTSYDGPTYDRLQQITLWAGAVSVAFVVLLTFISFAVTSNAIRSAVLARRDEVRVMRLVGAPAWAVRGPFIVEGALTGSTSGALAGVFVMAASLLALRASQSTAVNYLPGVTAATAAEVSAVALLAGCLLGAACGLTGLRRMPR
jgi:cell division transport system permease protein